MPIVFVHGVDHRDGAEQRDNIAARNGCLREIVGPALGLAADELHIANPYWGGYAAFFAANLAVLPHADDRYEAFGSGDIAAVARTVDLVDAARLHGGVVENARRDFTETVDVLYAAALAGAVTEEEARDIATSYLRTSAYAAAHPSPAWLGEASDANFADLLNARADASAAESFGAGVVLDSLREGLLRLVQALPDAGSPLVGRLARKKLNATLARFTGDACAYLARRGTRNAPGAIVQVVLDGLRRAAARRKPDDGELVIVAQSLGGDIVYDILSHFAPDLQVDCLVTVGAQVGLFEEMKLHLASEPTLRSQRLDGAVPRPSNIGRWLNVFDGNDVLSYRVAPVFDGADDFHDDTGSSSLHAHGGYFLWPSFYKRLAARLSA